MKTWRFITCSTARLQVEGYPNAIFKSYAAEEAAIAALEGAFDQLKLNGMVEKDISSEDTQQTERLVQGVAVMSLGS